ncbi:AMIN-like domain-containing (lipo)protein [Streptomyces violascens]|uniref:AMIN-like domain-containing (lipo)protein n=1 Tax=Streptomyces violascens TaxID=67381 RepID=UPI0036A406C0
MPAVRRLAATALVAAGFLAAGITPAQAATAATSCEHVCILDARTGGHPDYDRLVFDLTDNVAPPAVQAQVSADGSYTPGASDETRHLAITGKSYLLLDVYPAEARSSGPDAYTTPTVQPVSLSSLKGVQMTGIYEGHIGFGLSLGDYTRYQVSTLTAPNRIVVDLYH